MNNEQDKTTDTTTSEMTTKVRRPRGFAAMDRAKVVEIARKGGKAAHKAGTAHQFTSAEARAAGKKGGVAPHKSRGGRRRKMPEAVLPSDVPKLETDEALTKGEEQNLQRGAI